MHSYGGVPHSGSWSQGNFIHSGNPNLSGNVANWSHGANWSQGPHSQNFQSLHHPYGVAGWGYHDWDHYFRGAYWGPGWNGWGWWGWGYPFWFSFWGGYPFGWGGYYADYFCPYGPVYATAYPAADYVYSYADDGQYAANFAPNATVAAGEPPPAHNPQVAEEEGKAVANEGLQYYNEARTAFTGGDYHDTLRLAGHSAVESPQNAKVYELRSLALFALGEYKGAATEAHAALALDAPSDWAHLFSYYNDADRYTAQLRKLEKTVSDAPTSAPGHFLLGYHYLMTGAKEEAKKHFVQAAKLTPNDKLAQHILKQLESGAAITPPVLPKQTGETKGKQL